MVRRGKAYFRRNNRKEKYKIPSGLYPFVLLTEHTGNAYELGEQFVNNMRARLEAEQAEKQRAMRVNHPGPMQAASPLKTIETFRADIRYGGDGTRIDLAYAIYGLSHGLDSEAVSAALRSRDLTHKGTEQRQAEYVERTIRKAFGAVDACGRGR